MVYSRVCSGMIPAEKVSAPTGPSGTATEAKTGNRAASLSRGGKATGKKLPESTGFHIRKYTRT